jgi:hypothetical protein
MGCTSITVTTLVAEDLPADQADQLGDSKGISNGKAKSISQNANSSKLGLPNAEFRQPHEDGSLRSNRDEVNPGYFIDTEGMAGQAQRRNAGRHRQYRI